MNVFIQAVSNHHPTDITDPLENLQKLFNPDISDKPIWNMYPTLQKAIDYVQKIEGEFFLIEGIQLTEFHTVISINTSASNDPMKQQ